MGVLLPALKFNNFLTDECSPLYGDLNILKFGLGVILSQILLVILLQSVTVSHLFHDIRRVAPGGLPHNINAHLPSTSNQEREPHVRVQAWNQVRQVTLSCFICTFNYRYTVVLCLKRCSLT